LCVPAAILTPRAATSANACQPADGAVSVPPTLTPSSSTCSDLPVVFEASRAIRSKAPLVATDTSNSSHSPASVQPTLQPPPTSLVTSASTAVELHDALPKLADVVSLNRAGFSASMRA